MNLIDREELKQKLDRRDDFKLIMVMGEWAFRAQHIPGSINMSQPTDATGLNKDDEIVVYCTGGACVASRSAWTILTDLGFGNVRRYAGGLEDWATAGYPLEGEMVDSEE